MRKWYLQSGDTKLELTLDGELFSIEPHELKEENLKPELMKWGLTRDTITIGDLTEFLGIHVSVPKEQALQVFKKILEESP